MCPISIDVNAYYPPQEAGTILQKSVNTLQKDRSLGTGPEFVKLGKSIFYPGDKLLDHLKQNTFQHGAAAKQAVVKRKSARSR
jgi:hypothetical protein